MGIYQSSFMYETVQTVGERLRCGSYEATTFSCETPNHANPREVRQGYIPLGMHQNGVTLVHLHI